ncbi:MAG: hypothetical protein H0U23_06790 [Blastocatellia bacterium]|nr:hypothetical protein [Blastocatellia bacterium]
MDRRYFLAFGIGAASLALGILAVRLLGLGAGIPVPIRQGDDEPTTRTHDLSGPYTHNNLTIYLVHGRDAIIGKTPLTLEEAMDRKLVKVHETSDVNELEIENISATDEVFVQAGDIVKGGKQDRVLTVDLIVPVRSGRMPISSFCVEHGRWQPRASESPEAFSVSSEIVPSKGLKLAAKHTGSQAQVWAGVAKSQEKLSAASNANVASNVSRSSMQLSLEHNAVRTGAGDYVEALRTIVRGKSDVIGFVFAINGEINSSDTYGSHDLFIKLWPRLLKAAAIEAVSESYGSEGSADAVDSIDDFLTDAEAADVESERTITDRIRIRIRESKRSILIESRDTNQSGWLHRNYLIK